MAQLVDYDGTENTIDLIWNIGEDGNRELTLLSSLGLFNHFDFESKSEYEAQRLVDGSIVIVHEKEPGVHAEITISKEDAAFVITDEEYAQIKYEENEKAQFKIEKMTIIDVIKVDITTDINNADEKGNVSIILNNNNVAGMKMFVALLLAHELTPREVFEKTGLSASVFIALLEDMKKQGVFDGWSVTMTGKDLIANERLRQIEKEGYSTNHDDEHPIQNFIDAAICYGTCTGPDCQVPELWPWDKDSWKPKGTIRNLVRAGALYIAAAEHAERNGGDGNWNRHLADNVAHKIDEELSQHLVKHYEG